MTSVRPARRACQARRYWSRKSTSLERTSSRRHLSRAATLGLRLRLGSRGMGRAVGFCAATFALPTNPPRLAVTSFAACSSRTASASASWSWKSADDSNPGGMASSARPSRACSLWRGRTRPAGRPPMAPRQSARGLTTARAIRARGEPARPPPGSRAHRRPCRGCLRDRRERRRCSSREPRRTPSGRATRSWPVRRVSRGTGRTRAAARPGQSRPSDSDWRGRRRRGRGCRSAGRRRPGRRGRSRRWWATGEGGASLRASPGDEVGRAWKNLTRRCHGQSPWQETCRLGPMIVGESDVRWP